MNKLSIGLTIVENWVEDNAMQIISVVYALLLVGVVTALIVMGVQIASADDSDFAIHHDIYQPTVNLINLDGFQIEYWSGECVLRLDSRFTKSIDTLTVRVANAIPAYDILYYPARITSCVTRN